MEALYTEDDAKYANSKNMVHVLTEDGVEESIIEFDICNPKFTREYVFLP